MLLTSESKRIRLWDLRVPLARAGELKSCLDIDGSPETKQYLKTHCCPADGKKDFINGACKMIL